MAGVTDDAIVMARRAVELFLVRVSKRRVEGSENSGGDALTQKPLYSAQRHDEEADEEIGHCQRQQEVVRHVVEPPVQHHRETDQYVAQTAGGDEYRHEQEAPIEPLGLRARAVDSGPVRAGHG